jgi:hypothetical protein
MLGDGLRDSDIDAPVRLVRGKVVAPDPILVFYYEYYERVSRKSGSGDAAAQHWSWLNGR